MYVQRKCGLAYNSLIGLALRDYVMQNGEHLCTMSQSPQQLMYNLYNIIALTEVKGYAMVQFSYMMLKIYNKVS
jgi:hypothetical protein